MAKTRRGKLRQYGIGSGLLVLFLVLVLVVLSGAVMPGYREAVVAREKLHRLRSPLISTGRGGVPWIT